MNKGTMTSVPLPSLPSGEHDCLMTEVQIRSTPTSSKKHKHPTNWLKAHLCQNKLTVGLYFFYIFYIRVYDQHVRPRFSFADFKQGFFLFYIELCLTPECITLAADTYNAMNPTVDPCEVGEIL